MQDNLSAEIYDKKLIGDIEIKNLNFSYDNNNIVLKDINMSFYMEKLQQLLDIAVVENLQSLNCYTDYGM